MVFRSCFLYLTILFCAFAPFGDSNKLTKDQKEELLKLHNGFRAKVCAGKESKQPNCANMMLMTWDDRLEKKAQAWADQCATGHDSNSARVIDAYKTMGVGQNAALGFPSFGPALNNLFRELDDYDFDTGNCNAGKKCGHYTQLLQWDSHLVGCGYKPDCSNAYKYTLFCNYAPAGNRGTDFKIYEKGAACSNCPYGFGYCKTGLCAAKSSCGPNASQCNCPISAASCQNGGQFVASECRCQCAKGYDGAKCDKSCKDTTMFCGSVICPQTSQGFVDAIAKCRSTCDFCGKKSVAEDNGVQNSDNADPKVPAASDLDGVGKIQSAPQTSQATTTTTSASGGFDAGAYGGGGGGWSYS